MGGASGAISKPDECDDLISDRIVFALTLFINSCREVHQLSPRR
jgi:hypothetical protein